MRILSSKRRVAAVAVLVLLLLFLVRPGASRLKSRIITSLSAGVGRPVDLGGAHVRLLPRPGFDLDNLVIYDDPAFSSEPILRASEVTADLRLTSLLRGRLEVSRLDLTEPSLNLVHRIGGGWNLESLLERTAHAPTAPTSKTKSEHRPGFPYIEGTSARINLKNGPEKKPYALTNADFALWQESENEWGVRLKAQPFRSDMNLNDTGLLQVNGTWQRAATFHDTPVRFSIQWSRAQLGQVTKFLTGNDKGWRGDLRFNATVTGTPAALKISSAVLADDFRRYDITSGRSLRLAAYCSGEYRPHDHEFREIACNAPIGDGMVTVTGNAGLPGSHRYTIAVAAEKVPADAIGMLAEKVKKDLPDDLIVGGVLQGKLSMSEDAASGVEPRFEGRGEIANFQVSSASEKSEVGPANVPFVITNSVLRGRVNTPKPARVEIGPFELERGHGGAAVRGKIDRSGYDFVVTGDAEIARSTRVARMFGLHALNTAAEGTTQLNLEIAGSWSTQGRGAGFAGPQITGSAKLRNVRFSFRGAGESVEILSAEMQFLPDAVRIAKLSAKAAGTTWKGSLEMPRGCGAPEMCEVQFALNAEEIALSQASAWANSSPKSRPWYRVLGSAQPAPSVLTRVKASGHLTADRLTLHGVSASKVSADVRLNGGKLELENVNGDVLGGKHRGRWEADFSVKPSVCSGKGSVAGISLGNLSKWMKDDWVAGTASGDYEARGPCTADFWQAAEGKVHVNVIDGVLPHVSLTNGTERLQVSRFNGQIRLHDGEIEFSDGKLDSPDAQYKVSGTATFKREIDFKMSRVPAGTAYTLTGTLAQPRVAVSAGTEQARLKTPSSK